MGFYVTTPFDASEVEISAKWDAFPKFTAGTLLSSAETQDDAFEYLNQYYANLSDADVDAYINKLLDDGFIKTPTPVAYEKVANGKRYRASVGVRKASFVMSDDITYNPDGKYILLSPKTQINKEIKYTLHYTPTGLETTCNDIEVINLRASNPLTPGATTWTTNIEFYSTIDVKEPSKFYLYYTIHPVYMICDGEEVPVVFD